MAKQYHVITKVDKAGIYIYSHYMSDNDQVKLKPIFGIQPGKYLVILYSAAIAAVIFLVFFLPGTVNPGSVYIFEVSPENSAVIIDGEYKGAAPCRVFVPEGTHRLIIEKDYFTSVETEINSSGKLFASLIFPRKVQTDYKMELHDPKGLLESSFHDFAEWGMLDTFYENYKPKPILEPLFISLRDSGYADIPEMSGFLYSIIPFVHDEELYNDFYRAVLVFEEIRTGESQQDTIDIVSSFTEINFFKESVNFMENLPFWFYSLLTDEHRENNINWYPAMQEEYGGFLRDFSNDYPAPKAAVTVYGMRFVMLSGGQFLVGADGANFPYPAAVNDIMVMDREVTNELYALFLSENPDWRTSNLNALTGMAYVNEDYLKDFDSSEANKPVNFVSWYAAEAFCSWLESKLPAYLSEYQVRLPDEHEWEWIALTDEENTGVFKESSPDGPLSADGRYPNNSGFYDLKGNLWEWCENWYAPAAPLTTSRNPAYNDAYYGNYPGVEKSVRGGSWANEDSVGISARGSQPPEWCTEFLGFRPVLVKE